MFLPASRLLSLVLIAEVDTSTYTFCFPPAYRSTPIKWSIGQPRARAAPGLISSRLVSHPEITFRSITPLIANVPCLPRHRLA
jgi:hypothetical protein